LLLSLQALLEAFDATHVTSGMLWALIQGWCGDVAAALAAHAADVEPSVQLAANAAAGRWPAVVSRWGLLIVFEVRVFAEKLGMITLLCNVGCSLVVLLVLLEASQHSEDSHPRIPLQDS
jgi:hypothetical protein